jgi:hypothetical protein
MCCFYVSHDYIIPKYSFLFPAFWGKGDILVLVGCRYVCRLKVMGKPESWNFPSIYMSNVSQMLANTFLEYVCVKVRFILEI